MTVQTGQRRIANIKDDERRNDGGDAATGRQVETVELRLDGREVRASDGRRRPTTRISSTVPLPETERTAV